MGNSATRKLRTWMAHGTNKNYENFHKKRDWNKRKLFKKTQKTFRNMQTFSKEYIFGPHAKKHLRTHQT